MVWRAYLCFGELYYIGSPLSYSILTSTCYECIYCIQECGTTCIQRCILVIRGSIPRIGDAVVPSISIEIAGHDHIPGPHGDSTHQGLERRRLPAPPR